MGFPEDAGLGIEVELESIENKGNPFEKFAEVAHAEGYHQKIVGDDAYSKSRLSHSPSIKMISAKNGKIQLVEQKKVGGQFIRYEIEY